MTTDAASNPLLRALTRRRWLNRVFALLALGFVLVAGRRAFHDRSDIERLRELGISLTHSPILPRSVYYLLPRSFRGYVPSGPPEQIGSSGGHLRDEDLREPLSRWMNIRGLGLHHSYVTDSLMLTVVRLPLLEMLDLEYTGISDAGVEMLARSASIWVLDLDGTRITDAGVRSLAGMQQLRELSLQDTGVTDGIIDDLLKMPSLQIVELCRTRLTREGVRRLKQGLMDPDRDVHVMADFD